MVLIYHKHKSAGLAFTKTLRASVFSASRKQFYQPSSSPFFPPSVSLLRLPRLLLCYFSIMRSLLVPFFSTLHNGVKVKSPSNSAYLAYSQIPRLRRRRRSLQKKNHFKQAASESWKHTMLFALPQLLLSAHIIQCFMYLFLKSKQPLTFRHPNALSLSMRILLAIHDCQYKSCMLLHNVCVGL